MAASRSLLAAVSAALLAGCVVPVSVKPETERTGSIPRLPDAPAVAVVFSRDFSPETSHSLGNEMVACITDGLAAGAPEVRVVTATEAHRTLFGVEPGEVLLRPDILAMLLTRPETRRRASEIGLTHLVMVSGHTWQTGAPDGGFIAGPGGGTAVGWLAGTRSTRLTASIFELAGAIDADADRVSAGAAGRRFVTAVLVPFPFVVGGIPATESASCQALGAEVARAMRGGAR